VFGDIDGAVVIPKELEKKVIPLALEKVEKENIVRLVNLTPPMKKIS
jgi:regulator of RNase E activity RraA